MTPAEACEERTEKVIERNKKESAYSKGFKMAHREKFIKGQIVAMKEFPEVKDKNRYGNTGKIIELLEGDSYLVKCGDDKIEKRNHIHLSRLPIARGRIVGRELSA